LSEENGDKDKKDDEKRLTSQEKDQITSFLAEKRGGPPPACTFCGVTKWVVSDHLVTPKIHPSGFLFGGPSYPSVLLVCANCGYTMTFNAVVVGLDRLKKSTDDKGGKDG
jgi:hypothetical protein